MVVFVLDYIDFLILILSYVGFIVVVCFEGLVKFWVGW